MLGLTWKEIGQYLQFKTPDACFIRHEWLLAERADSWDPPKMHNLAKEYMSMHEEIWSGLAARMGEDWRVVEEKVCNKYTIPIPQLTLFSVCQAALRALRMLKQLMDVKA